MESDAHRRVIEAARALSLEHGSDPLKRFRPTPEIERMYQVIDDWHDRPGALELHIHGANKAGKTMGTGALLAAWLSGRWSDIGCFPRPRAGWPPSLVARLLGADLSQMSLDVLSILVFFLPDYAPALLAKQSVLHIGRHQLGLVSWLAAATGARRKLEGVKPIIHWSNEQHPFTLWEEAVSRNPDGQPLLVMTATMGLERQSKLTTDDLHRWRDRAQRGHPCRYPEVCSHRAEAERIPGVYHFWIPFEERHIPWMTRSAIRQHIARLPEQSRAVRTGRSWETIPEGRYWPLFSESQTVRAFDLGDIQRRAVELRQGIGPSSVTLSLTVDCGTTDPQAGLIEAWYPAPCSSCASGPRRGLIRCPSCQGRGTGCVTCVGRGSARCLACDGKGQHWHRWTLAEHVSRGQHMDRRRHNVAGLEGALLAAGLSTPGVAGPVAAGHFVDVFVIDNQTTGQEDTRWRTEAEALRDALRLPAHVPAHKLQSERAQVEEGNLLLEGGRWVIHPRCVHTIRAMTYARWGEGGKEMPHDADSDIRACVRYGGNHFLLRAPLQEVRL